MFYRLKFDGYVGGIFKRTGYDTNASMDIWPVGRTLEWVQKGQELSLKPLEAAAISVADLAVARVRNGTMTLGDARYLVQTATDVATEGRCSQEVYQILVGVATQDLPDAAMESG